MKNRVWVFLCGLLLLAADLGAQARPNFTGHWILNRKESHDRNGKELPYASFRMYLVDSGASLYAVQYMQFPGKAMARKLRYEAVVDGRSRAVPRDAAEHPRLKGMRAAVRWDDVALVVTYDGGGRAGAKVQVVRRMTLSPDGRKIYAEVEKTTNGVLSATTPEIEVWNKQ